MLFRSRLSSVDCDTAVKRVAELEKTLESERADSKKRLEEAEQREIELLQAQKVEVSRCSASSSRFLESARSDSRVFSNSATRFTAVSQSTEDNRNHRVG